VQRVYQFGTNSAVGKTMHIDERLRGRLVVVSPVQRNTTRPKTQFSPTHPGMRVRCSKLLRGWARENRALTAPS